jgi:serine/threonine protein kinase/tetratricopeptide (TPR) repeat protein
MELARIGKYEIVSRIGQGAMGEVYKAHDPVLNRFVAVKTMTGVLTSDDELVERFRREAQSAARLNHVNIVTVYDFGEEQGRFYMAMELLEGVDLKEVIGARGLNDLWDKLDVMEQVADGLAFAHAQGVVHRDLKPANIRVLPSGRVKIMDFGLARMNTTSEMTRSGMVMGTPNYMSPEQVRGERADARSDVFALGAVFYELLAGRKAFQADSMHTILFKVLEEQPEPVERLVPDLPARFVHLIERALQKDPQQRFQHAGEMRDSLRMVREALAVGDADATAVHPDDVADTMIESNAPTVIDLKAAPGAAVSGATALDINHLPARSRPVPRPAPTLSGRSATHPPRAGAPSRASVFGILAVVVAVALGATFWWWARPGVDTAPPVDITSAQVGALTAQLVGNQIELARADLQNKDYRGAIAQAERALRLDAESSEARQVITEAEAQLAALEQHAAAARAAYQRGDTEAASRALGLVLAIDPRHPAATELTAALNQHFRRQAEDARGAVEQARTAAAGAGASTQEAFAYAERMRGEAEALLRKDEFAVATQRLLQARDGFERARRTAEAAARAQAQAAARAAATPPSTLVARGMPAVTLPPVTMAPVTTAPPITADPPAATAHDAAIRRVIAEYARAIEGKDLALFRAVKPNLSSDEEKRLQDAFKAIKSQQVGITVDSIQVDGAQATVRVSRQDTINGKAMRAVHQTFRLVQDGPGWTIQTIGQ